VQNGLTAVPRSLPHCTETKSITVTLNKFDLPSHRPRAVLGQWGCREMLRILRDFGVLTAFGSPGVRCPERNAVLLACRIGAIVKAEHFSHLGIEPLAISRSGNVYSAAVAKVVTFSFSSPWMSMSASLAQVTIPFGYNPQLVSSAFKMRCQGTVRMGSVTSSCIIHRVSSGRLLWCAGSDND
jgi:hypothetical protein